MANLLSVQTDYLNKICTSLSGMKALLLDEYTVNEIGLIYTQTELISHNIYHISKLSNTASKIVLHQQSHHINDHTIGSTTNHTNPNNINHKHTNRLENLQHLKCIVVVRPTDTNIKQLQTLIQSKQFAEYYIYFTNIVSSTLLEQLASSDKYSCVVQIYEYYLDYYILNEYTYHFNCYGSTQLSYKDTNQWLQYERELYDIHIQSLLCIFLSMKKKPDIRFASSSDICRMISNDLERTINNEYDLFSFNSTDTPLCLILDRHSDCYTPLLHQWTYKAMIHDLLNIKHNRVTLPEHKSSTLTSTQQQHDVTLNSNAAYTTDPFYSNSQYLNFGDLGAAVKQMVSEYSQKKSTTNKLDTIEELTHAVESLPELKQVTNNVNKHVSLMIELNNVVNQQQLMKCSEIEQDIVCTDDYNVYDRIINIMNDSTILFMNKLRIVMLYSIKYAQQYTTQVNKLQKLLRESVDTPLDVRLCSVVDDTVSYGGTHTRNNTQSTSQSQSTGFLSRASNILYSAGGVNGVENIYTRHKPYIHDILTQLQRQQLSLKDYPSVDSSNTNKSYRTVILCIIGGITYEEQTYVQQFNANNQASMRVILGGSTIHNADTFIKDIQNYYGTEALKQYRNQAHVININRL